VLSTRTLVIMLVTLALCVIVLVVIWGLKDAFLG
jgi:hypothetical protein